MRLEDLGISDGELKKVRDRMKSRDMFAASTVGALVARLDSAERALQVIADNRSGTALYLQDFAAAILKVSSDGQ